MLETLLLDRCHCSDEGKDIFALQSHYTMRIVSMIEGNISAKVALALTRAFPNLESFNASLSLQDLSESLPDLSRRIRVLDLSSNVWLNDRILAGLQMAPIALHLDFCPNLSGAGIAPLLSSNLRHLSLSMIPALSDAALVGITTRCHLLRSLELAFATALSSDTAISSIASLTFLETLVLCRVTSVSDVSICAIAKSCQRLQVLNLRMCSNVGSIALSALYTYCRQLRLLHCVKCSAKLLRQFQARQVLVIYQSIE